MLDHLQVSITTTSPRTLFPVPSVPRPPSQDHTASTFSYAIGPLAPSQITRIDASLPDGEVCPLLVPVAIPRSLLDDPAFRAGYASNYLSEAESAEDDAWMNSVPCLVNHLYACLTNTRLYRDLLTDEVGPDFLPWQVGWLLRDLTRLAERDATLIDAAAFQSKNLYNAALYEIRQAYIFTGKYLNYHEMDRRMQSHEAYQALPAKVSQQVLMQVHHDWDAFFKARAAYKEDPSKFTGRPKLPKYKDKTKGRNLLVYTLQALRGGRSKRGIRGIIRPSGLSIEITTRQQHIDQVRIVPRNGFYVVEAVYSREEQQAPVNPVYYAGIDIGMNNLVALTSNKPGFCPVVVNGRPVKSINQFYNKRRAELQSQLRRKGTSKRMERLTNTRNRRIDHYLHTVSRRVINLLVKEDIGTLVIGKNDGWKQEANMGKRNNQNFVQIPHARFIQMLTYKAELVGIRVKLTEESYTSQASLLDLDPLPVRTTGKEQHTFSGKRIKRGLYRAKDGRTINADINGSGNIIRKVAPAAFSEAKGVEDGKAVLATLVVHPVRFVVVPSRTQKTSNGVGKRSVEREKTL